MIDHYDLIAIPKGKFPGGPIQASDGRWFVVLPIEIGFAQMVNYLALAMWGGLRPSSKDLVDGAAILVKHAETP